MEAAARPFVLRQLHEMGMVGEKQNLGVLAEVAQGSQRADGAVVVEVDQQVVEDQRHRFVIGEMKLQASQAEGEKQLVASAFAEASDGDCAIWHIRRALSGDDRLIAGIVGGGDS